MIGQHADKCYCFHWRQARASQSSQVYSGDPPQSQVRLQTEWHCCCVSIQSLHPSEAAFEGQLRHYAAWRLSQFEGSIKCSPLFPLFGGCTATILHGLTYSKILCAPEKEERKKERDKMATSRGVDHHFRWPGQQSDERVKTSGDATRKCSKGQIWQRLTWLTRSLWRTRLRRPQRPRPSKDADPELRHSMYLRTGGGRDQTGIEHSSSVQHVNNHNITWELPFNVPPSLHCK